MTQNRTLGKTGFDILPIGLGTWQVGGKWGSNFDVKLAHNILDAAADNGINFIDTADVYSDGESEKAIGEFLKTRKKKFIVATKLGRQINPHVSSGYEVNALKKYVEESLKRLQVDCIDLIQLHCPPTDVYYRPEIFELFDKLKTEGKIKNLGVSVERVEEALKAIEYENVSTVQIIFNIMRQRPSALFFKEANKKNIGIIARVPLASGMLTGKFSKSTTFEKGDHRFFNRNGEMFDKGETFSGVDYEKGLLVVEEIKEILGVDYDLPVLALKWILMHDEVSVVIPGASNENQIVKNLEALSIPEISTEKMEQLKKLYFRNFGNTVHHWW